MEHKWLVAIGRVSYGMYIYHWAILVYLYQPFLHSENLLVKILLFVPYVILVYLIAQLSYNKFELYFIKLKDVYANNKARMALKTAEQV
jgi:peptidoglycan/LPS O-acetylase OafA/YrhL